MKIGQIATMFNISVDHIRYYINIGLLVPERKKTQYHFTEKDLAEIKQILHLKSLNFSLKEIHKILSFKRVSHLVDQKDISELIQIHETKKTELLTDQALLEQTISRLDDEIISLWQHMNTGPKGQSRKTGVPLEALSFLHCPYCHQPLRIKNGDMDHLYIYSGQLHCTICHYSAEIQEGIIITPNKNTSMYDQPDLERGFYLNIPPKLVSLFQKSYNWMLPRINMSDLRQQVILETHINAYFFLYQHINDLNDTCIYIVIDKFPEMISMYKQRIEHLGLNCKIVYIADNSFLYPLKKGCVDLFIDYFSSNEQGFYNESALLSEVSPYFHDKTNVLGTYFYFDSHSNSIKDLCLRYPEASSNNFNMNHFKKSAKNVTITIEDEIQIGHVTKTGDNRAFSFHQDGERMHMYSYQAIYHHQKKEESKPI